MTSVNSHDVEALKRENDSLRAQLTEMMCGSSAPAVVVAGCKWTRVRALAVAFSFLTLIAVVVGMPSATFPRLPSSDSAAPPTPPTATPPPPSLPPPTPAPPPAPKSIARFEPPTRGEWSLPKLSHENISSIIIEIGTNREPDFRTLVGKKHFYLMIEPLTVLDALNTGCAGVTERCALVTSAIANYDGWSVLNIAVDDKCSSLLGGGAFCAGISKQVTVPTTRLDTLLRALPPELPVELIAFDCQGLDYYAAASMAGIKDRVANIIVECQDLPHEHDGWLYRSPKKKNCGEIIACVEQELGFKYTIATRNMGPYEYNIAFSNPKHKLANASLRHPYVHSANDDVKIIEFSTGVQCDKEAWLSKTP